MDVYWKPTGGGGSVRRLEREVCEACEARLPPSDERREMVEPACITLRMPPVWPPL